MVPPEPERKRAWGVIERVSLLFSLLFSLSLLPFSQEKTKSSSDRRARDKLDVLGETVG